jgi:hypothetical protein
MDHCINYHLLIYDRFNKIISLLFKMELDPSKQALITPAYIVECIFSDENYMFTESLLTSACKTPRKALISEHSESRVFNVRYHYVCGITHNRIIEHALAGGEEAPRHPSMHEGKLFTSLYGAPWPLFFVPSDEFQQWCTSNGHCFNLKAECPLKLLTMACFQKMRTGGSIAQFSQGYKWLALYSVSFSSVPRLTLRHQIFTHKNSNDKRGD